jgi:hypothetical protein
MNTASYCPQNVTDVLSIEETHILGDFHRIVAKNLSVTFETAAAFGSR